MKGKVLGWLVLCWWGCTVACQGLTEEAAEVRVPASGLQSQRNALGKALFEDARFSRDGRTSCISCHLPQAAYSDTLPLSAGVFGRRSARNTPPLVGIPKHFPLMWDGGVGPLQDGRHGVLAALTHHADLDLSPVALDRKLSLYAHLRRRLLALFPGQAAAEAYLSALHGFVLSLGTDTITNNNRTENQAPYARVLPDKGRDLFAGKAGCSKCHSGGSMSDGAFHRILPLPTKGNETNGGNGTLDTDAGLARITHSLKDIGRFRTPRLVNLGLTAPYFHDGSAPDLESVLEHYLHGAEEAGRLELTPTEQAALLDYLKTL